jgi:site-specific recombinase XerD
MARIASEGLLFPGTDGRPLTRRQAGRRIARWARTAGLAGRVSAHALRHTLATRVYGKTRDILLVQAALGHRSVSSSAVYARADEPALRAALTN